jgi:hypothetical protein
LKYPCSPRASGATCHLFAAVLGGLLLFNFVAQRFRFDLTEEKRLHHVGRDQLLRDLTAGRTVTVYSHGDFPPAFCRLEQGVRETPDRISRSTAGQPGPYFIDPSAGGTEAARNQFPIALFKRPETHQPGATRKRQARREIIFPHAAVV